MLEYSTMKHILQHHCKSLRFFILSTLVFILFWVLTLLKTPWLITLDQTINSLVPALHMSDIFNALLYTASEVFEPKIFIVWFSILLLLLTYKKKYFEASFLAFGVLGGQVIKAVVKYITNKPRPENPFGIVDFESSFPSGHATVAVFLFFAIYYLVTPYLRASWRPWVQGVLIAGMITVPLSRVFLQVHYMSDIIAGIALGTASFAFTLFIFDYFYKKTHTHYPKSLEK